jgi:hypothetical protein
VSLTIDIDKEAVVANQELGELLSGKGCPARDLP